MSSQADRELNFIIDLIKNNYGINLTEKRPLIIARLNNYLQENSYSCLGEFNEYLVQDKSGSAINELLNRLTTNHTYFMREAEHFHFFSKVVLPYINQSSRDKDMRIWSAGCSSGEEAYTLAILIDEYLDSEKDVWDRKILATDISERILKKAILGVFESDHLKDIPLHWKSKYFKQYSYNQYTILDSIKSQIIFRRFNLIANEYPFKKKFHTIFCRNVMIYFDMDTKRKLVQNLYNTLDYGGYLFIGHSESLSQLNSKFKYIMPAVYRKE